MKNSSRLIYVSVALICLAAIAYPLVSSLFILPMFEDQLLEQLEKQATQTGNHLSRSMIVAKDFASDEIVRSNVSEIVNDFELEKIKVFEGSGKIIYSTSPDDIGRINKHPYFHNVVMRGRSYSELVRKDGKTKEGKAVDQDVVEVYVPLWDETGHVIGALEIYSDVSACTQALRRRAQVHTLCVVFGSGSLVLLVLLFLSRIKNLMHTRQEALLALKTSHENLEQKVIERTREMQIVNDRLLNEINDRKEAEASIQKARDEWQRTFDSTTDMITILDADQHVVNYNRAAAEAGNLAGDKLLGQHCFTFVGHQNQHCEDCPTRKAIRYKRPFTAEIEVGDKSFLITTSPILNEQGEMESIIHIAKDITGLKELERTLLQHEKMAAVGRLAGGIGHDFNNQLGAIAGFCDLTLNHTGEPEKVRMFTENILKAVERSSGIISDLLACRQKRNVLQLPVHIKTILAEAVASAAGRLNESIKITTSHALDDPIVAGDASKLENVFLNLIINAGDAMPEGGRITITSQTASPDTPALKLSKEGSSQTSYLEVTISDTGSGISKKALKHIFEPFYTTKPKGKGTGMGLAVAHGTIQSHNGEIVCESREGKGTTFRILLPTWKEQVSRPV